MNKKTAWFDELLDTQMKICRGSGVLVFVNNQWKIKHYVLSMTFPNDNTDEVIKIKAPIEDALIIDLKGRKYILRKSRNGHTLYVVTGWLKKHGRVFLVQKVPETHGLVFSATLYMNYIAPLRLSKF